MTVAASGTREVLLADLTPFPGNARRGDLEALRDSVRNLGQYRALVVRDTGDQLVILAGNHTAEALAAEGMTKARCEIITCDDDTARRINLIDNRSNELAAYDERALVALLQDLPDLTGTGYSADDLEELLRTSGILGEQATGFLGDLIGSGADGDSDEPSGVERPHDAAQPHPGRIDETAAAGPDASIYVQVAWTMVPSDRDVVRSALTLAQQRWQLATQVEALVSLAHWYLDTQHASRSDP